MTEYPIPGTIRPYEEIPEEARDYADFICNVAELGEGMGQLYGIEDQRIKMHIGMVAKYGLRYEYTRQAVCLTRPEIASFRANRLAQIIDANLRYIKDTQPESRIQEGETNEQE